jgi:hypothetical protein
VLPGGPGSRKVFGRFKSIASTWLSGCCPKMICPTSSDPVRSAAVPDAFAANGLLLSSSAARRRM